MPQPATAIDRDAFLRVYIMGAPKIGKSTSIISTAPSPVYVINCDDSKTALQGARRRTTRFEWDLVRNWDEMQTAVKTARDGVKAGKYKTIVVDTFSAFAAKLEEQCLSATDTGNGPDGRRAYPDYERRLRHLCQSFFNIPAHFIAVSHFIAIGGEVNENGTPKFGEGIAPLLAGKARVTIPMLFADVVYMDMRKGERIFVTNSQGAWGPGCRSLEGSETLPADIGKLLKAMAAQGEADDANERRETRNGASARAR